jgi:hypothetical protein
MTELKEERRRRTRLLDDLRNRRRYWEQNEEAEDREGGLPRIFAVPLGNAWHPIFRFPLLLTLQSSLGSFLVYPSNTYFNKYLVLFYMIMQ